MIDPGLEGKVVLITGANHGIGAATAKAFAAQRAKVFLTSYGELPSWAREPKGLSKVVKVIRTQGGQAEAWEADLVDPANIPRLFDRAEATFGPVEVLVNNAAHWEADSFIPAQKGPGETVLTITPESHDRHFAVNSRAAALMMAELPVALLRGMRGGAGSST